MERPKRPRSYGSAVLFRPLPILGLLFVLLVGVGLGDFPALFFQKMENAHFAGEVSGADHYLRPLQGREADDPVTRLCHETLLPWLRPRF